MVSIKEAEKSAMVLHNEIYNKRLKVHVVNLVDFVSSVKRIVKEEYEKNG